MQIAVDQPAFKPTKSLRRFFDIVNYYSGFTSQAAETLENLMNMLRGSRETYVFTPKARAAFQNNKKKTAKAIKTKLPEHLH